MSFLDQLNPVQREAVEAVDGPVMIVAGAGSGKTRVLTYRAAHLLGRGVRPDSVLALTFTNKAAEEMKGRITALVGQDSRSIWMGTFHSVFARILRMECEHIGYQRNFSIYDTDDSLSLVKGVMNDLDIPQQQFSPHGIRSRISHAKNQMLSPKEYLAKTFDLFGERAALVYKEYEKRLGKSNALDFDDLLLKPLSLFSTHPDVLERYHHRFKYILVDEYQDTNRVQYALIKQMAKMHRNVCVVGDDAQSIYGFRGADIRNILDFEKDYPDCRVFRLEQNYRSTKTILDAAHSIIKNNINQIPKKLWTENHRGEQVVLSVCEDDREEAYRIVTRIEEESRKNKRDLKDFAILYRTNAQSRLLEDALRRSGIPYSIVGGVEFYKRREIKDVLAYLKLIANPKDEESLLRIINVPPRSIGNVTISKLKKLALTQKVSLFDALGSTLMRESLPPKTSGAVLRFFEVITKYIKLKNEVSASELGRALVDEIGILAEFKSENTQESLARRENVQELLSALTEYSDLHGGAGLEDFLAEVSLVSDVDTADFGRNAVTLMTLHAAKGLEFPVVFITGLEEGLFPLSNSSSESEELEEERRLFYVGMTRAMERLFLSYALSRYRHGQLSYSVRSRFLDEVDGNLIMIDAGRNRRRTIPYRRHGFGSSYGASFHEERTKDHDINRYFSDRAPHYEEESQEPFSGRVGARVIHDAFGRGRIVAIDGNGEDARAVVDFESVGRKHLLLKFAHLRAG